jgi:hypothetical protein
MTVFRGWLSPTAVAQTKRDTRRFGLIKCRAEANPGEYVGWKLFHIADIRQLTILPRKFLGARPDYKRNDKAFVRIEAQI